MLRLLGGGSKELQGVSLASGLSQLAQDLDQLSPVTDLRIRFPVCRPLQILEVGPYRAKTAGMSAFHIVNGVVADMDGLLGAAAGSGQCCLEQLRRGLARPQVFGAQGKVKILHQADLLEIGIAVGDRAETVVTL